MKVHSSNACQTLVAALKRMSQSMLLDPHQVQHGRLNLVQVDVVLDYVGAEVVGLVEAALPLMPSPAIDLVKLRG